MVCLLVKEGELLVGLDRCLCCSLVFFLSICKDLNLWHKIWMCILVGDLPTNGFRYTECFGLFVFFQGSLGDLTILIQSYSYNLQVLVNVWVSGLQVLYFSAMSR